MSDLKLNNGDEILIRATVNDACPMHGDSVVVRTGMSIVSIPRKAIDSVSKRAWAREYQPKVGDVVTWGTCSEHYQVLSIMDGHIWLLKVRGHGSMTQSYDSGKWPPFKLVEPKPREPLFKQGDRVFNVDEPCRIGQVVEPQRDPHDAVLILWDDPRIGYTTIAAHKLRKTAYHGYNVGDRVRRVGSHIVGTVIEKWPLRVSWPSCDLAEDPANLCHAS